MGRISMSGFSDSSKSAIPSRPAARLCWFRRDIGGQHARADRNADCRGGLGRLRQRLIAGMGPQIFLCELALGIKFERPVTEPSHRVS